MLSRSEQEVLYLLNKEFLTIGKVAIRRETSVQAVYRTIRNLKKKGVVSFLKQGVEKKGCYIQPYKNLSIKKQPSLPMQHQIRLHSQEFNIRILHKDKKYRDLLKKANTIYIDGNTIRLYSNTIEIYSGHSFYADDVQKATADSFNYLNRLLSILENDLKVILVKSRSQNIKLVKHHYAEINNELAKDCNINADKIKVFTTDDGKLWFLIDNSFNLHEAETIHPVTARQDIDIIKPFFNDLRDNQPALPSEMQEMVFGNAKSIQALANQPNVYTNSINALTKQINLHLGIMQGISKGVNNWNKRIDKLSEVIDKATGKGFNKPKNKQKDIIGQLFNDPVRLANFKLLSRKEQNKILEVENDAISKQEI